MEKDYRCVECTAMTILHLQANVLALCQTLDHHVRVPRVELGTH